MAQARKLHEILGSQSQIFGQAEKVRKDLSTTFEKKRHLFEEKRKQFQPLAENSQIVVEEESTIQSTVPAEIAWMAPILAKALDSEATIDEANTKARADVRLDNGTVLLEKVPATQLLQLEKRLTEIQQFITTVPTLDPAKGFAADADRGAGIYKAREVRKQRTAKVQEPIVVVPPTEHHPAQVHISSKDVVTGTIQEQEWSGLITPQVKATMLSRVEELRRAVKQARARANDVIIEEVHVGKPLLEYVFQPVLSQK